MEDYYWDIANKTKMGDYLTRKEREFIDSFLKSNTITTCLDVACGSGRFSIPISQYRINVVAVDYDLVPLKKLKNKNIGENIIILRGDAGKLPFKKSSFDCIISIQTVDNLGAHFFFKECNRVLKKDGVLLFTTANSHSYKKYIHKIFSKYGIFYRYSFDDIMSYLIESGLEPMKYNGYNWLPFGRDSNSTLLGIFEYLENFFKLGNLPSISSWIFFTVKKKEDIDMETGESNENSC